MFWCCMCVKFKRVKISSSGFPCLFLVTPILDAAVHFNGPLIIEIWHIFFVNSLYSRHLFHALSICIWLGNSYLPLYIFVSAALSETGIGRCKELILCSWIKIKNVVKVVLKSECFHWQQWPMEPIWDELEPYRKLYQVSVQYRMVDVTFSLSYSLI